MATSSTRTGYHSAYRGGVRVEERIHLYTNHTTTDTGTWIDMSGVESCNYEVNGITTGTLLFHGSNETSDPGTSVHAQDLYGITTDGAAFVKTMTADGLISFPQHMIYRWMKVRVSVATTITLDIILKMVRHQG